MAELNKNKKTEDDPIKSMLEKLRQSVAAPIEEPSAADPATVSEEISVTEQPPVEEKTTKKKTAGAPRRKEAEPAPAVLEDGEEEAPAAVEVEEIDIFSSGLVTEILPDEDASAPEEPTEDDEDDAMDGTEKDEDTVNETVIAQFFSAVPEEVAEESQEESVEDEAVKEETLGEDDGREYDVISFEDLTTLDDEDGEYIPPADTGKELEIEDVFWQNDIALPSASAEEQAEEPTSAMETAMLQKEEIAISDQEAELLFRAPAPKKTYSVLIEEEETEPVEEEPVEEPIVANEDNGYAVEVEVRSTAGAWYIPTVAQVEEVKDTLQPAEELIDKVRAEEEKTIAQEEPVVAESAAVTRPPVEAHEEVEDFVTDDFDETDAPVFYGEEGCTVESTPVEGAAHAVTEEQEPAPDPAAPASAVQEENKPSARRVLAAFFGKGNRAKRKKVWDTKAGKSTTPEALSGIYNEAGADYHEYTSRNQIGLFTERFKAELTSCTVRIFALAFLCTLLLIIENIGHVGITLGGFFAQPGGMAAAHLILLAFVMLCSVPMFSYAWRHLFGNRVLPEIYIAMCLLFTLLYDVYLLLASVPAPYLFGLVPALGVLALSVVEWIKIKGDFSAFELVSSAGDKLACSISAGAQTREEADAVADLEEGRATRILSVKKVGFTVGFFHRVSRICEDVRKNLWLLITALVASVTAAVIGGVFTDSLDAAFYIFCVTVSFAFPACSLVLHKIPVAQLFRRAAANRCAVVGEVSAMEYCDAAAAAFEDVEAFPARNVRVQRIKLYGDNALDQVLYQVAGLFSTVGGPLDGVFRSSTAELGLPAQVRLLRVETGGIAAMVDGREVCVGRGEYMLKNRIRMYYDPEDENILTNGKVNIMYAAENGRLTAKFYVRYKMDEDFEKDVEQLHKRGIRALIRTYDPNIDEDLISGISYTGRFQVQVVKKTVEQQNDFAVSRLNSGIVSRATTRHILQTLFSCRRMCRMISVAENASLLVACGGMLLSLILSVFGTIFGIPTFFLALYQLFWIAVVALFGKLYI